MIGFCLRDKPVYFNHPARPLTSLAFDLRGVVELPKVSIIYGGGGFSLGILADPQTRTLVSGMPLWREELREAHSDE